MTWVDAVIGGGVALVGREVAGLIDRRRKKASRAPAWIVDWKVHDTWTFRNVGDATGFDVRLAGEDCFLGVWEPHDIEPDEERGIQIDRRGRDAQLLIYWTSKRGGPEQGPARRYVPPAG